MRDNEVSKIDFLETRTRTKKTHKNDDLDLRQFSENKVGRLEIEKRHSGKI